jgi:hypothetical protein
MPWAPRLVISGHTSVDLAKGLDHAFDQDEIGEPTTSFSTLGAKGRKDSRRLILALMVSFMLGTAGLARIERSVLFF